MSGNTALYRLYDSENRLLYVGITNDPPTRFVHHKREKTWWGDVARREIEWLPSRMEALAAEEQAIHCESPFWNVSKSLTRAMAKPTPWSQRAQRVPQPAHEQPFRSLVEFMGRRYREALAQRDELRREVAEAIRQAAREGMPQKEICEATGYTRQQVRRIVMADGEQDETAAG